MDANGSIFSYHFHLVTVYSDFAQKLVTAQLKSGILDPRIVASVLTVI